MANLSMASDNKAMRRADGYTKSFAPSMSILNVMHIDAILPGDGRQNKLSADQCLGRFLLTQPAAQVAGGVVGDPRSRRFEARGFELLRVDKILNTAGEQRHPEGRLGNLWPERRPAVVLKTRWDQWYDQY